ncbi:MAG: putative Ig domain-containing protein [Verrucomicrobia bacterium]|nr:putative Ig domain-containing protein [Verrucomicrobiota bacterium]
MNPNRFIRRIAALFVALCTAGAAIAQTATLTAPAATYSAAGGSVTLTITFVPGFTPNLTTGQSLATFGVNLNLPAGWSMADNGAGGADVGGANAPTIAPDPGSTDTLGFAYITPPNSSTIQFTAKLNYPKDLTGNQTISGAVQYKVTDKSVTPSTTTALLTLNFTNLVFAPVLTAVQAIPTKGLTSGTAAVSFTPVTGLNGATPYAFAVSPALPAGLTLSPSTGAITGTPTATSTTTTYTVTITDSASSPAASNTFSLTVNAALASTLAVPTKKVTVNTTVAPFTPVTTTGGTPAITFAVNPALPAGLNLSVSDGSIAGTPTATFAQADYVITATDNAGATTTKTLSLGVFSAVTATQDVAAKVANQGQAVAAFTPVSGANGATPLVYTIAPTLPAGLTLNSGTGAISGTPTTSLALTTFTVTVTDAAGSTASRTFDLTVNGPLVANVVAANPVLTAGNGAASAFAPVVAGGGTPPYTYTISPALPSALNFQATALPTGLPAGSISGTPAAAAAATTYTVTVTDSVNATASNTFSLTINPALVANKAVATKTASVGAAVASFIPVTATGGTSPFTFTIAPALPTGLSLTAGTGAIAGTPTVAATATTHTVTITDSKGAQSTNTFSLTVNVAPTAASTVASRVLTAGAAAASFTPLTLTGGTTPYAYTVAPALPTGLALDGATGTITGTPAAALTTANFTITGTDAAGATVTQVLALTINPALVATAAGTIPSLTANTAVSPAFVPVAASGGTAPYAFAISPAVPASLAFSTSTGAISGTPDAAFGPTTMTVTVTDAVGATKTATFSLKVFGPLTATQAIAARILTATAPAVSFIPVVAAGGTEAGYVYSVNPALPSALTLNTATGAITGTPAAQSAPATFTITVKDNSNATASATFSLTVNPALVSTLVVATKGLTRNTLAMPYTPVTGADGTLPYAFTVAPALPAGLALSATSGEISGTPTAAVAATNYTVTITDNAGATTSKVHNLTVNAALAPAAGTIATKALTASTAAVAFTPLPVTGGTAPINWSQPPPPALALPAGLTLNPATGAITGTPTTATAAADYTIIASDAAGAMITQTLNLTINPPLVATTAIATKVVLVSTAATAFTPVTITGGTSPFVYTIAPALPAGLVIAPATGAISGTPTVTTNDTVHTVTVTDSVGATANSTFTLRVDRAPTITTQPTANASYLVGAALTLNVVATGSPTPTYQWQKGGTDITGKTTASLAFGALALTDAGTYRVVVTNPSGSVTSSAVSFLVYLPPAITTQPASQTVIAGQTAAFTVVATGDPTPTYQWMRNGLNVPGATGATFTLNNTPFNAGGTYTVAVSNPGGSITSNAATLTVNPVAPSITSPVAATAVAGRTFIFQIVANTSSATYTVATGTLPAGLTLNADTGLISGTPTATGTANLTITATNATAADTKPLAITVNSPPPVITVAVAPAGQVGTAYTAFTVTASNSPTAMTATGLPPGLTMSNTGVISGTPTQAGTFSAAVTATNATGSNTSPVVITINLPPNLPAFTGSTTLAGVQGTAFNFTPAFANGPFTNFTATGLPTGLAISATTGAITGTPTVSGTFTVNVTATNAGGSTTVAFTLTLNPPASAPTITGATTASGTVGSNFSFTLTSSGTPAATSYAATGLPGSLTLNPATGVISGIPTAPATITVQVSATNTVGTGPQRALVITIVPAANAPVINSAAVISGRVGDVLTGVAITATNSPTGFAVTGGTLPAGLALNATTGAVTGTPTAVGQTRVAIAATNATGQGYGVEILFSIAPALTMPVVTSNGTAAGQVGQPFQYVITASNAPTSFGATPLPAWLTLNATSGVLSGIPSEATTTALSIQLTATNNDGTSAPKTLSLSIAPPPATPMITSPLAANGQQGVAFTYQVTASESPTSYVALSLPAGLSINTTSGAISGTPTVSGMFTVTLRAANNAGPGVAASLVLNLAPAAAAPAITSAPAATGKVGVNFTYPATAAPTPITAFALIEADTAEASRQRLPLGLVFNTSTGILSGQPAESGIFTVQLTASGAGGVSLPQALVLNISPPDGVPVITSPTTAGATVGASFSYQITAIIMPGATAFPAAPFPPTHSLDAVNLPAGLAVNPSTGLIEGQPLASGTFVATLYGVNATGRGPYRDLTIVVQPAPTAPVITSSSSAAARVGTAFSYQITASNNPTSYEAIGAPAWMSVNSQNGALAGTPTAPGLLVLLVRASNSAGVSGPGLLTIAIDPAANTPVITSTRTAPGTVSAAFSYQATATVPAGAPAVSSYLVIGLPPGLTFNSTTGAIGGTPTASGTFNVVLSAINSNGQGAPVTLVINIAPSVQFVAPGS